MLVSPKKSIVICALNSVSCYGEYYAVDIRKDVDLTVGTRKNNTYSNRSLVTGSIYSQYREQMG
jgi:hypothetical protein